MGLSQRRAQLVARLRTRKTREREGLVLVEGIRGVGEALAGGAHVRFAVISPRLERLAGGAALRSALVERGVEIEEEADQVLEGLADTEHPQGVLMVCVEDRPSGALVAPGGRYLVLDGIQDPGNVGTLVRASTAFGLDGVLVLDGSADPWGAKAVRAAAGMTFRVPVLKMSAAEAIELLRVAGLPVLVADASGRDVGDTRFVGGWALVVGNEGSGPRPELMSGAEHTVRIPMPGPAESLNAGVAGAILLYALTREVTVAH
jgi:TrmH family RNA methyltransferase